ncbi:MAG: glycosyltransferase [Gemmataceae bacterium]|nr:glycosyltransferase [Gemmataceae bacterium]
MSHALRTVSSRPPTPHAPLLTEAAAGPGPVPFELWDRYVRAAGFIDELCCDADGPVRVLDVGCNVVKILSDLLDPARVQVVRCDVIEAPDGDPDYVQVVAGRPLPFDDGSFDAVVALEVLEHVPAAGRSEFLRELSRVADRGVVVSCPHGAPAVHEAERLVSDAYLRRHGEPHPFLREHSDFGLPTVDDVRTVIDNLGANCEVHPGIGIDRWVAATLLAEGVLERSGSSRLQEELTRVLMESPTGPARVPYRHYFVIDKRAEGGRIRNGGAGECPVTLGPADDTVAMLHHLASTAAELLTRLEPQHGHVPASLREVLKSQQDCIDRQELRFQITNSFADALTQSASWRLLAPLRAAKNLVRPARLNRDHLIPWRQLVPSGEPGGWTALGDDPQFIVSCYLPRGWVRIRIRATSTVVSRLEVYAEDHGSFVDTAPLCEIGIAAGRTDEEFFVRLDKPTRALRIDPLNCKGTIKFDRFDVSHRPGYLTAGDALRRKLRLLRAYRNTGPVLRRGLKLLFTGQWREVAKKWSLGLDDPRCTRHGFYEPEKAYERWIEKHRLTDDDRAKQRQWAVDAAEVPLISVVLPTYNTPERYLRLAIDSVIRQTYPRWELCIADDGSTEQHVRPILEEYAARDHRIKLAPPGRHGGISRATNAALAMAQGDFVALFDHDDELAEHALYRMARAAVESPDADVLYSDEDKIQPDGKRVAPFFKPAWSPEFFLGCMYTCHLSMYRTDIVRQVGGFDEQYDGAQDYDLAFRVIEKARRVVHVPDVLYHWRLLPNSTASGVAAKPHAHAAAMRAIESHLARTGQEARAEVGPSAGLTHVRFALRGTPTVSIIIPSLGRPEPAPGRSAGFLENCVQSIRRLSTYRNFEVLVLDRNTLDAGVAGRILTDNVRRLTYDAPFNWSAVNNLGARAARGEFLLFLNDDTEVTAPGWIEAMIEFAQQREVGAVGAKLHFPDGGIQHVGVSVLDGNPGHPFYGYPKQHSGYYFRNFLPHNCAAVTGACLMSRAEVFREVGGFDEGLPLNYNDVDYCYRVRKAGYRVVFTPHAVLTHFESVTKPGVFREELHAFQSRWGRATDPYYNPHLNEETYDYRLG